MAETGSTVFYVKHMVCPRGLLLMRELLLRLGLTPRRVELGEVEVIETGPAINWMALRTALEAEGFELLERQLPQQRLVQAIKQTVAEVLATSPQELRCGRSAPLLSQRLGRKFSYLSNAFSTTEGQSLERYIIGQRIAAAERLLRNSTLGVGRIALSLGYSSLGHLSRQFRLVKGISPTDYRRQLSASPAPNLTGLPPELYEPHQLPNE
ncbi:AraC family transcriptional regulator [Hymenobacter metallilatus]|uniref:AraC family transcriptional regulator n=2 Tax=Hymenobacter metallilatus TaxID=2493666 RepID=A0A428IZA3_9BACT|nr:AraC family transcriptional regulator [Hymenobacter metallilatus]